jgi:hypothetical protein
MVRSVELAPGELRIELDGASVRIFNPYHCDGVKSTAAFVGKVVQEVAERDDRLAFIFSERCALEIDVSDEAYEGPEALIATFEDGTMVVQ